MTCQTWSFARWTVSGRQVFFASQIAVLEIQVELPKSEEAEFDTTATKSIKLFEIPPKVLFL